MVDGSVLVGAEFAGVDEELVLTVPAGAHVDGALVLIGETFC